MPQFPTLKTGAVAQYPIERSLEYSTQVNRFLDGSEQRYRDRSTGRRQWVIELSMLNDTELANVRNLFDEVRGKAVAFDFTDPWTGGQPVACRFADDEARLRSLSEFDSEVRLVLVEAT